MKSLIDRSLSMEVFVCVAWLFDRPNTAVVLVGSSAKVAHAVVCSMSLTQCGSTQFLARRSTIVGW